MPESYEESRVRVKVDGQGEGVSDPTRNPREAGELARHNRKWLSDGGLGGEVEILKRTVTVGDWTTVEKDRVEPKTGD